MKRVTFSYVGAGKYYYEVVNGKLVRIRRSYWIALLNRREAEEVPYSKAKVTL